MNDSVVPSSALRAIGYWDRDKYADLDEIADQLHRGGDELLHEGPSPRDV
jgi:hypothetical protein